LLSQLFSGSERFMSESSSAHHPAPDRLPADRAHVGLAIASLVESGIDLGWIPRSQTVQAGLILVAVPFVL
jgi:hypothetical protein